MQNGEIDRSIQPFEAFTGTNKRSFNDNQSNRSSSINHSGNSDVDVNVIVQIDTMPIALSFLCLSLARKQLTRQEFESAVEELVEVTNRYKKSDVNKYKESKVKLYNDNKSNRVWGRY